jgi:hypothetical protein
VLQKQPSLQLESIMSAKAVVLAAVACVAAPAYAGSACDAVASQQYRDCVRIVDSLHPDKAGQARVFARDGSEFTAGQASWMKGQLRKVARLCASGAAGDQEEATRLLAEIRELIRSHQRNA